MPENKQPEVRGDLLDRAISRYIKFGDRVLDFVFDDIGPRLQPAAKKLGQLSLFSSEGRLVMGMKNASERLDSLCNKTALLGGMPANKSPNVIHEPLPPVQYCGEHAGRDPVQLFPRRTVSQQTPVLESQTI